MANTINKISLVKTALLHKRTLSLVILAFGVSLLVYSLNPSSGGQQVVIGTAIGQLSHSKKQLRPIEYHHFKKVCTNPRPGMPGCYAFEATTNSGSPVVGSPAISAGYGPAQFHTAYNLPCTPGGPVQAVCTTPSSFGPQTVAIVDAGNLSNSTTVESSLGVFDSYYNLPSCTAANGCLDVVNQAGATSPLPADAGWDDEIMLDVETAHMVCQTCRIVLVEATSATIQNLAASNVTAAGFNPIAISNSWGLESDGNPGTSFDSDFIHSGIVTVVSTGDGGSQSDGYESWPAEIPQVLAAAGTSLEVNTDNTWASESVWADSGGGCSVNYGDPPWQSSLANWSTAGCGNDRAYGDLSADANPDTGEAITIGSNWYEYGGTSLSAPLIASMFALVGSEPNEANMSSIAYGSYSSSSFHDITSGSDCLSGGQTNCTAGVGFDTPTGLGSPNGLAGLSPPPSQPTSLTTTVASPTRVSLSWTASAGNLPISGYDIYKNGVQIASTSSTAYNDNFVSTNEHYNYYVVAYDSLGNLSSQSSTILADTYLPEDINEDGHINLLDLSLLASKYGQSGQSLGREDINDDGQINLLDLSLLAGKYSTE